jgi:hypothetical protein
VARRFALATACLFALSAGLAARPAGAVPVPAGSAFTYQGRLTLAGVPLSDTADLRFSLFDGSAPGATQIGSTIPLDGITITDGRILTQLDFGAAAFNGEARWLEITVRSPAGGGAFTTLSPRQPVTPAPYAIFALNGSAGGSSPWQVAGTSVFYTGGDVGIGTSTPLANLHVSGGPGPVSVLFEADTDNNGEADQPSLKMTQDGGGVIGEFGFFDSTNDLSIRSINTGGFSNILLIPDGNVGIGTSTPLAKLHIAGGTDADVAGGGFLICGTPASTNLAIDDNEIMALNNGAPSPLFINTSGGTVALVPSGTGNVGIGTGSPTAKLDVRSGGLGAILTLFDGAFNVFTVTDGGGVGLGVPNPTFQLHLSSNSAAKPTSNVWTISSDARLKKNVNTIEHALDDLLALRGVTYQWIDPASQGGMDGTYTGMIAQDVEPVFPEWIGEDANGYKTLTVIGFEGIVVEALRDLRAEKDAQIEALRSENQRLQDRLAALEDSVGRLLADRPVTGGTP